MDQGSVIIDGENPPWMLMNKVKVYMVITHQIPEHTLKGN